MAKKENREGIALQCSECKNINYLTRVNYQQLNAYDGLINLNGEKTSEFRIIHKMYNMGKRNF